MTGQLIQINISKGGVPKMPVNGVFVNYERVVGDDWRNKHVHGGPERVILMISKENIDRLKSEGLAIYPGALGENFTTLGFDYRTLRYGDIFQAGKDLVFRITKRRAPCKTITVFGEDIANAVFDSQCGQHDPTSPKWGTAGFYASILNEGYVSTWDTISKVDKINFTIRRVEKSDIEALSQISRETFYETFAKDNTPEDMLMYLEEAMTENVLEKELIESEFWFLCFRDHPVGYMKLEINSNMDGESALEVSRLYVLKKFVGTGGGTELMSFALQRSREVSAAWLWLAVWELNTKAIAFYTKWGFEKFGQKKFKLGTDLQTDVTMKRKV